RHAGSRLALPLLSLGRLFEDEARHRIQYGVEIGAVSFCHGRWVGEIGARAGQVIERKTFGLNPGSVAPACPMAKKRLATGLLSGAMGKGGFSAVVVSGHQQRALVSFVLLGAVGFFGRRAPVSVEQNDVADFSQRGRVKHSSAGGGSNRQRKVGSLGLEAFTNALDHTTHVLRNVIALVPLLARGVPFVGNVDDYISEFVINEPVGHLA